MTEITKANTSSLYRAYAHKVAKYFIRKLR